MRLFAVLVAIVLLGVITLPAHAQSPAQIRQWDQRLAQIERRLEAGRLAGLELRALRVETETIVTDALTWRDRAGSQAKQIRTLLTALGPAPAADTAPETATVAQKRRQLASDLAAAEGQAKEAGLIATRGGQVLARFSQISRARFKETLLQRSVSPLVPDSWADALRDAARLIRSAYIDAPTQWWRELAGAPARQLGLVRITAFSLLAALLSWPIRRWLLARYGRRHAETAPSHGRRLLAGLVEGVAHGLIPVVFVLVIGVLLVDLQVVTDRLAVVIQAISRNLALFFIGYALIDAAVAPRAEQWRLLSLEQRAAARLAGRLKGVLVVFLVFDGLRRSFAWSGVSPALESVYALLFATVLGGWLLALTRGDIWRAEDVRGLSTADRLRGILAVSLLAPLLAALAGYPRLTGYLLEAAVLSGIVGGGLWLARATLREAVMATLAGRGRLGAGLRETLGLKEDGSRRLAFWINGFADLGLLLIATLLILPIWGLGAEDTLAALTKLLRGIEIGSYTFSLIDVMIGLALFVAIVVVTRMAQRGLARHILPNLTRDRGLQDALQTGVGYLGVIIAVLVGVAALGLDLSSLAIIAGALSVGIGFGLQNVVNNFVSGLILLVERPIKQGDWVIVGAHEGRVKKVNVRSTEIETFQRASVIIPNADLIANSVTNWTHKNQQGRIDIPIGVAYGTDDQHLRDLLIGCATAHDAVMATPAPDVLFMDFADSALLFELRVYVHNIEQRMRVASDLRHAIYRALNTAGIEIPFPQRVVHLQSDDEKK